MPTRSTTTAHTPLMVLALVLAFATLTGCNDDKPNPENTPEPGGGGRAEITLGPLPIHPLHQGQRKEARQ